MIGTKEQTQKFEEVLNYYKNMNNNKDQETIVNILRETQDIFGFISPIMQDAIATGMNIKPSLIAAIIKRYPSLTDRKFSNEITVCRGERCSNKDSLKVLNKIEEALCIKAGQVTKDGKFKLTTKNCMHRCKTSVNMTINENEYSHVTEETVLEILKTI